MIERGLNSAFAGRYFGVLLALSLISALLASSFANDSITEESVWYYRGFELSQEIVSARTLNTKVFINDNGHRIYRVFL